LALIEQLWGYSHLRPLQQQAMEAVLAKRDSVVVMPTGGGKSLCYQAPAIHLARCGRGPTVVVSPLIALMKDQVDALQSLGVAAAQIDSSLNTEQRRQTASLLRAGKFDLLFVSPEKLVGQQGRGDSSECGAFVQMLRDSGVQTFAIDEAHCVSHWGHDFRPEYRRLSNLKTLFPGCSIHAFTATATEPVRADIAQQLQLANPVQLVGNFDRPNLTYRVLPRRDMMAQIHDILERHQDEAGIIYCLRRRDVDDTVAALNVRHKGGGPKALGYHAGMTPEIRRKVQEAFAREQCDLIVATIAFGMGIDRSNIRFVLHTGMPKSIEAYQQETGRAGRDGLEAECVLLYSGQDVMTWKALIEHSAAEAVLAGTPVSPDYVPTALRHLDDMDRFARGAVCRHKALVEYFGQRYVPPIPDSELSSTADSNCQGCDHCLGDTEPVAAALVIAQKILSAVARTDQCFGVAHILAVLRGENTEKIRQLKHDQLSVHGLLRDYAKADLRNFVYQLVGQGVLVQENLILREGRMASILKLNQASVAVMKGQRQVRLIQLVQNSAAESGKSQTREISWQGVEHALFDALRVLRRDIAAQRGVAPYVILSDATLRELARVRPTTLSALRLIYGIGEAKLKSLGDQIVPLIADYCRIHNIPTDVSISRQQSVSKPVISSRPNAAKDQAFQLFAQGGSMKDVAAAIDRTEKTVAEYLADYITIKQPKSIAAWVPDATFRRIESAIGAHGSERLKPIFIALDEKVPYEYILLVIAWLQSRQNSPEASANR
ncbi:MAG: RecQ family ATP-dependent DNA helicase, partial [Phycisphaerae bacterium]